MIPLHDDNPTELFPVLTITFIATCVLVFFWQVSLPDNAHQSVMYSLGVIPAVLLDRVVLPPSHYLVPAGVTVITSMFMHGGFMHLAGNMLYLWIFGNNVEDAMGHGRFILFYLLCGVGAVAGQTLQNPDSLVPMIGASGAISGVLGAYLLLYPHARVLVLIPFGFFTQLVRMPAGWVLGLWFLVQLASSALAGPEGGGVAWFAHIGGFVTGMLLVPLFKRRKLRLFQTARGARSWHERIK